MNDKLVIGAGGHWRWAEQGKQDWMGLKDFSDADGASQHHQHSILGYIFTIDGRAISWSSKKQPIIALSMTEAEYIATMHTAKEALLVWMFLSEVTSAYPPHYPLLLGKPKQWVDVTQADDEDIQSESINGQLAKESHLMMGISKEKKV